MNIRRKTDKVWIGLVGVFPIDPRNNLLNDAIGAYVNFLTLASNYDSYVYKLQLELEKYNLQYFELEDVEPFEQRIAKYEVEDYILSLVNEVNKNNSSVFGTFHTFKEKN